jgi:hypothetical protein
MSPLPLRERASNIREADVARVRGLAPIGAYESASPQIERAEKGGFVAALPRVKPLIPRPFSPKGRREIDVLGIERAR